MGGDGTTLCLRRCFGSYRRAGKLRLGRRAALIHELMKLQAEEDEVNAPGTELMRSYFIMSCAALRFDARRCAGWVLLFWPAWMVVGRSLLGRFCLGLYTCLRDCCGVLMQYGCSGVLRAHRMGTCTGMAGKARLQQSEASMHLARNASFFVLLLLLLLLLLFPCRRNRMNLK